MNTKPETVEAKKRRDKTNIHPPLIKGAFKRFLGGSTLTPSKPQQRETAPFLSNIFIC
ncbi:MAG: hypothetical protein QW146_07930 [Candidatus Bathyarchaeia archaeon]